MWCCWLKKWFTSALTNAVVLYLDKNQLFFFCLCEIWFASSNRKGSPRDGLLRCCDEDSNEEALGALPFKTFVVKIWLQFSSFNLGHCCPPWTRYADALCEIPVLDLRSDKIKHSGIDCQVQVRVGWAPYHSVLDMAQVVVSLPLSFSSHPVACRDSSEDFLAAGLH